MRSRRESVAVVLAISVIAAVTPGFAASLGGLGSKKLGADDAVVSACDTDGFTVNHTVVGGNVTAAVVSGIADPGCEGGQLSLTVANASGTSIGSGGPLTIAVDAGTVDNTLSVTLAPQPAANLVASVHVVVTGP